MHLFYNPYISGDLFDLDEGESKHAVRVLRIRRGEKVVLVDGAGGWYEAVIVDADPRRCRFRILSHQPDYRPLSYRLHLAISPTKSTERYEWFLEKATEIGISEITPLLCRRTERARLNPDRMERILVAAMKQSLRAYKPVLHPPASLTDFVRTERDGFKGIAHCMPSGRVSIHDLDRVSSYTFMVGPEGDFTEEELQECLEAGFLPLALGEGRLRTETAGVFICAAISLMP